MKISINCTITVLISSIHLILISSKAVAQIDGVNPSIEAEKASYLAQFGYELSSHEANNSALRISHNSNSSFLIAQNQTTTRFQMIEAVGSALEDLLREYANAGCTVPTRSYNMPQSISSRAFYFDAYDTIGRLTGRVPFYVPGGSKPLANGNSSMTRGDMAIILNRYFFNILKRIFTQATVPSRSQITLSTYLELLAETPHAPASTQKSMEKFINSDSSKPSVNLMSTVHQFAQVTSVTQYTDIGPQSVYRRFYKDIEVITTMYGVMIGFPDGTFKPLQQVPFGTMVSVISNSKDRAREFLFSADCASRNSSE